MPNEQYLEEFVSPAGFKQLQDLSAAVAANNKQLQDGIVIAKQYTDQIGSAKGIGDFNAKAAQAAKAQEAIASATAKTQLAEEKLQAFRDQQQAKQDAAIAKQVAADEAKLKRIAAIEAKEAAAAAKASALNAKAQKEAEQLRKDQAAAANEVTALGLAQRQNAQATNQNTTSKRQQALAEAQAKEAVRQNNLELRNQARELNAAKGSLEQRAAALGRLQRTYAALNEEERNSAYGRRLSTVIPQLNQQVLTLEQSMGRSQRNVGNYVTGFDRLTQGAGRAFGILRQVAYILPGVGIAGIIGFLTEPIVKYIASLDIFKDKLSQIKENLKALNDVNKATSLGSSEEITSLKILYNAATDVNLAISERVKAANELKKLYPESFKNATTQAILNGNEAKSYQDLTKEILLNARAKAVRDKLADIEAKRSDIAFQKEKIRIANYNEVQQQVNDQLKRQAQVQAQRTPEQQKAFAISTAQTNKMINDNIINPAKERANAAIRIQNEQDKILDGQSKFLIKYAGQSNLVDSIIEQNTKKGPKSKVLKEQPTNFGTTLEDIIKQSEAIFKNDQNSYEKRLGALDSYIQNSQLLAEGDEGKLNLIKLNGEKERIKIIDQANKEQLKLITESEKARVQELLSSNNDQFEALEAIREKDTVALEARYDAGKISKEDYEKELFNIESSYAKDRIAIQIDTLAQIVEIQRSDLAIGIGTNEDLKKSEKELSALRIQLAQLQRKEVKQTSEERIKAAEKELSAIKQLTEKSLDFGKALIDGIYTRRLNALSDESAALDKKKQQDIENVNDSVLTEQQKADQIAIINARAESQQSAIDERIRQQKIKQARADKAQAIAQIIIQTALAQIKVIGQAGILGFVFSPLITALGALSLATAIATPIPKFAVGTEHSPEGLAWVGERGTEGRINPDGTTELTPNKPTLTYLEKGTKIIPNHKLYNKMAKPDKSNFAGAEQVPWSQLIQEQRQTTKVLKKAFGDQSVNSTQVTKGGWKATQTKMSNLQKHIKRNLS